LLLERSSRHWFLVAFSAQPLNIIIIIIIINSTHLKISLGFLNSNSGTSRLGCRGKGRSGGKEGKGSGNLHLDVYLFI
jgi:hypothetical protein